MVVCLAARVLCRGSRMALCRRSDVSVGVLYSKPGMRRGSRVFSRVNNQATKCWRCCCAVICCSGQPAATLLRLRSGESARPVRHD